MRARGLLAIVILAIAAAAPPAALAGGAAVDFAVTPSKLDLRVAPGERSSTTLRVYNQAEVPLRLRNYVQDVDLPPSDLIGTGDIAFSAAHWARFAERTLTVPPGGAADVGLMIDVPAATPPGGYHALAYLQSLAPDEGEGTGPQISARVGVTLLLEVAPPDVVLTRAARQSAFDVDVSWDGLLTPVIRTTTTLDNVGDTYVLVGGLDTYRGWPGSAVSRLKVGPEVLLRGTRDTFVTTWTDGPLFGRVSVTSEIVYQRGPDDLPAIVVQQQVWVVPWRLLGLAALAAAVAIAWRRSLSRRRAVSVAENPSRKETRR